MGTGSPTELLGGILSRNCVVGYLVVVARGAGGRTTACRYVYIPSSPRVSSRCSLSLSSAGLDLISFEGGVVGNLGDNGSLTVHPLGLWSLEEQLDQVGRSHSG